MGLEGEGGEKPRNIRARLAANARPLVGMARARRRVEDPPVVSTPEAPMATIEVENYKKSAQKITQRWQERLAACAKKIEPIDKAIAALEAKKPPGPDDKAKLAKLQAERKKIETEIEGINTSYSLEMALISLAKFDAKDKDVLALPAFVEGLIKGVKIGPFKLKPKVEFDFKSGKLKKVGIEGTF
jgi:hypothetical protein